MAKKIPPAEVDAFIRQLKWLLPSFGLLIVLPIIVYVVFMDHRLSSFEDSLRFRPPQETSNHSDAPVGDLYHLAANPVSGQTVYVPAYSHIYHGDGDPYLLTITLSVRNTSIDEVIFVKSVRYFDSKGKMVRSYLQKPARLPPLGTTEVLVERDDTSGGSGASFLVEWFADQPVTEPIIEAVMIDTRSQQGISFARRGSVIGQVPSEAPASPIE